MQAATAISSDKTLGGWKAQTGLLVCGVFPTIGLFAPGIVLPQIASEFAGVPNASLLTELIGAIASFAFAISAPLAGHVIAKVGSRPVILWGLIFFGLFGVAPAFLDNLWLIVASRIGVGIALAGIFTGSLAGIGQWAEHRRAALFGLFSVVGSVAAIVLFPLLGVLGQFGWRPAFSVYLVAFVAIPLAGMIPAALGRVDRHVPDVTNTGSAPSAALSPAMVGLILIAGLVGMSMFITPIYSPIYLSSIGITNPALLAVPVTAASVAGVGGSAAYGWIYRRLGLEGVTALCLLVLGAALCVAGLVADMIIFTFAMALTGAMMALISPNISAAAIAYSPPHRASQAVGLANGVMFGSQLLFPFIATWVRSIGGLSGVFLAFAGAVAVSGVLVILTRPRHRSPEPALG